METGEYRVIRALGEEPQSPETWGANPTELFFSETTSSTSSPATRLIPLDTSGPGESHHAPSFRRSRGHGHRADTTNLPTHYIPSAPHTSNMHENLTNSMSNTTADFGTNNSLPFLRGAEHSLVPPTPYDSALSVSYAAEHDTLYPISPSTMNMGGVSDIMAGSMYNPNPRNVPVDHNEGIYYADPVNASTSYSNPFTGMVPTVRNDHSWRPSYDPSMDFMTSAHPPQPYTSTQNPEITRARHTLQMDPQSINTGRIDHTLDPTLFPDPFPRYSNSSENYTSFSNLTHHHSSDGYHNSGESIPQPSLNDLDHMAFLEMLDAPQDLGDSSFRQV